MSDPDENKKRSYLDLAEADLSTEGKYFDLFESMIEAGSFDEKKNLFIKVSAHDYCRAENFSRTQVGPMSIPIGDYTFFLDPQVGYIKPKAESKPTPKAEILPQIIFHDGGTMGTTAFWVSAIALFVAIMALICS